MPLPLTSHRPQPKRAVGSERHCNKHWAGLSQHELTRKTLMKASSTPSPSVDRN